MAYCKVADVKNYLDIKLSGDDSLIGALIKRAQVAIDSYCRRSFESTADTTRSFGMESVDGRTLWLDEDLASVTTVTNYADATTPETVTSAEYVTQPRNEAPYYAIRLKGSSSVVWGFADDPADAITIAGAWAYSTSAPEDIVQACVRLSAYYYRQKDAQVFDVTAVPEAGVIQVPQGIPRDVKLILDPYRRL